MSKRLFDLVAAIFGLIVSGWLLLLIWAVLTIVFGKSGIFTQTRIGRFGKPFTIFKFRTMHPKNATINGFSKFLRQSKFDELPQLVNVLTGDMSIVGPRPDIPGYYDLLQGEQRKILELRPGITSLASLKYKDEETILAAHQQPLKHNDEVLFPDKVRMNLEYYYNQSLALDLKIIWQTLFGRH